MEGWLARAEGWLARAGDLASHIFQNDRNPSQNLQKSFFYFLFRGNLEEIHPVPPRASSGRLGPAQASSAQLRPARPSSFCSKNPRPSEDLKFLRNPCPEKCVLHKNAFFCTFGPPMSKAEIPKIPAIHEAVQKSWPPNRKMRPAVLIFISAECTAPKIFEVPPLWWGSSW